MRHTHSQVNNMWNPIKRTLIQEQVHEMSDNEKTLLFMTLGEQKFRRPTDEFVFQVLINELKTKVE